MMILVAGSNFPANDNRACLRVFLDRVPTPKSLSFRDPGSAYDGKVNLGSGLEKPDQFSLAHG
jgi:hypothetical protein